MNENSTTPTSIPGSHKKLKGIIFLIFILLACIAAFFWWKTNRRYITTDDANVASYRVNVASQITGIIDSIYVSEGTDIIVGDTLFTIKDTPPFAILSPVTGSIAKQWLIPGDMVRIGQTVYTINKGKEMWIAVFLEETKFSDIYLNQPVLFTLSAYPHLQFHGKIFYIGDNTASEFALIPASNASGNFTKVTQRIGLKISIDSVSGQEKYKQHLRIVSGMSATVKIIRK